LLSFRFFADVFFALAFRFASFHAEANDVTPFSVIFDFQLPPPPAAARYRSFSPLCQRCRIFAAMPS
jgi:hypothetical protein